MSNKREYECPWCGGSDKRSKEHVIAQWISRFLARHAGGTKLSRWVQPADPSQEHKVISSTLNTCCDVCNKGWMKGLEDEVKPFLSKMLVDEPVTLSSENQRSLAAWAMKTIYSMSLAEHAPAPTYLSREGRRYLQREGEPPAHVQIWVARQEGVEFETNTWLHAIQKQRRNPSGRVMGYQTFLTMVLHHLTFQIATDTYREHATAMTNGAEEKGYAFRIWPLTKEELDWPPTLAFSRPMLEAVARPPVHDHGVGPR